MPFETRTKKNWYLNGEKRKWLPVWCLNLNTKHLITGHECQVLGCPVYSHKHIRTIFFCSRYHNPTAILLLWEQECSTLLCLLKVYWISGNLCGSWCSGIHFSTQKYYIFDSLMRSLQISPIQDCGEE